MVRQKSQGIGIIIWSSNQNLKKEIEIVILSYSNHLFINPTIKALITMISSKGWFLKLICPKQNFYEVDKCENIDFIQIPKLVYQEPLKIKSIIDRFKDISKNSKKLRKYFILPLKTFYQECLLYRSTYKERNKIYENIDKNKKTVFIAVGSIASHEGLLAYKKKKKSSLFGFLSFEIECWDEHDPTKEEINILKNKDISACKELDFLVIQDPVRENLFRKQNKIDPSLRTFHIPVAPLINYKLPKITITDKINIIHSGSIRKWSGIDFIIDGIKYSNIQDFSITIHSFDFDNDNNYYKILNELSLKDKRVKILKKRFTDNEHISFLTSFNIGVCIYQYDETNPGTCGKNMLNIGLSSGKFSLFMKLGIPVICNFNQFNKDLLDDYEFGYLINSPKEWDLGIHYLNENYSRLSKNCKQLFNERLDPLKMSKNLFNYLDN